MFSNIFVYRLLRTMTLASALKNQRSRKLVIRISVRHTYSQPRDQQILELANGKGRYRRMCCLKKPFYACRKQGNKEMTMTTFLLSILPQNSAQLIILKLKEWSNGKFNQLSSMLTLQVLCHSKLFLHMGSFGSTTGKDFPLFHTILQHRDPAQHQVNTLIQVLHLQEKAMTTILINFTLHYLPVATQDL